MNKKVNIFLFLVSIISFAFSNDKNEKLELLSKLMQENFNATNIQMEGKIELYAANGKLFEANNFSYTYFENKLLFKDDHNIMLSLPEFNLWIEKSTKSMLLSKKPQPKKGKDKNKEVFKPQVGDLSQVTLYINTCLYEENGNEKIFRLTYTEYVQYETGIIIFNKEGQLKSVELIYSVDEELSKQKITYTTINKQFYPDTNTFSYAPYIYKSGDTWRKTKTYQNYSFEILSYEEVEF